MVALENGDIRLVRSAYLLLLPLGSLILYRQQLEGLQEVLELQGASPLPLLSPAEAVALIRKCNRSVGALTYGWLSPGSAFVPPSNASQIPVGLSHVCAAVPDPAGQRLECVKKALEEHPHIEACFWDFPSLFQVCCASLSNQPSIG